MNSSMSSAKALNKYLSSLDNHPAMNVEENLEIDVDFSSLSSPPFSDQDFDSMQGSKASSDEDDEEIDMEYLNEKREILKRYCDAMKSIEAYTSSISNVPFEDDSDSIWTKAKEVMKDLSDNHEYPTAPDIIQSQSETTHEIPPKKRQRVCTSTVTLVSSSLYNNETSPIDESIKRREIISEIHELVYFYNTTLPCPTPESINMEPCKGGFQSVLKQNPIIRKDSREIITRYNAGAFSAIPLSGQNVIIDMTIEDAFMISEKPRLIYEAHPPFSIVHVNKAFMECTGKSNEHLVGKPVEDVIASDVSNTIVSPILPKSQQMRGKIGDTVFQYSIKAIKSHISSYFLIEMVDNNLGTLGKRAINQINHSDILVGCIG